MDSKTILLETKRRWNEHRTHVTLQFNSCGFHHIRCKILPRTRLQLIYSLATALGMWNDSLQLITAVQADYKNIIRHIVFPSRYGGHEISLAWQDEFTSFGKTRDAYLLKNRFAQLSTTATFPQNRSTHSTEKVLVMITSHQNCDLKIYLVSSGDR